MMLNDGQRRAEAQRGSPIGTCVAVAAGQDDGDFLKLSNARANATITRLRTGNASVWEVETSDADKLAFPDIASATRYALAVLSLHTEG